MNKKLTVILSLPVISIFLGACNMQVPTAVPTAPVSAMPLQLTPTSVSPTTSPTANVNARTISFANGKVVAKYNSVTAPENTNGTIFEEFIVYQDPNTKYFARYYKNPSDFSTQWSNKSVDSDGINAGQGEILLTTKENINGNVYQRYISYYNPIGMTKSGKYDSKVSSVTLTSCVSFLTNGGVLMVSPIAGAEGSDGCAFVKEHNLKF